MFQGGSNFFGGFDLSCEVEEFENYKVVNSGDTVTRGWKPPPRGSLKINSDAAVKGTRSFLSIVARDKAGGLVEAYSFKVSTRDPLITELLAVQKALTLSLQNG